MIYFDTPREVRFRGHMRLSAHMASDVVGPEGTTELLTFAEGIGLRPGWIQNEGTPTEHFDLFDDAIVRAEKLGAIEVEPREFVAKIVNPKRANKSASTT